MRILLADDHALARAGFRRLLENLPGVEVVAESRHGGEVLDLVALHHPDVVVLDPSMTGPDGVEVTSALQRQHPDVSVLVTSAHTDAIHVRQALDAGARGYMVKDAAPAELALALQAVTAGHIFLSPQVSGAVLSAARVPGHRALSPRQTQILRALGQGHTTKEIAARLSLSVKTVETHRARMMETLGLRNANQLLRYAVQHASDLAA